MTKRTRQPARRRACLLIGALLLLGGHAQANGDLPRKSSPAEAKAYLISPRDGETLSSPVTVRFGLQGMGVAPAGVAREATGHHHLLIDTELPPLDLPVPSDAHHRHFGGGQTETTIELSPGTHSLQMILADELHIPHAPPVLSEKVVILVE